MALVRTEDQRLVRDTRSMALLNTDRAALALHRAARQKSAEQEQLVTDIQSLKAQVEMLTLMVQQLSRR